MTNDVLFNFSKISIKAGNVERRTILISAVCNVHTWGKHQKTYIWQSMYNSIGYWSFACFPTLKWHTFVQAALLSCCSLTVSAREPSARQFPVQKCGKLWPPHGICIGMMHDSSLFNNLTNCHSSLHESCMDHYSDALTHTHTHIASFPGSPPARRLVVVWGESLGTNTHTKKT